MSARSWSFLGVCAAALALVAPADATDGGVTFENFAYSPAAVRITPGATVTFAPASGSSFTAHPLRFVDGIDDSSGSEPSISRQFATPGVYRFYCDIHGQTDGHGNVSGMSGEVIVSNDQAPVAGFTAPASAPAGKAVTLDAGTSTDDKGIASYAWDFDGDGTIDETDTTPTTTHAFTHSSTIRLTVSDANHVDEPAVGDETDTVSHSITIQSVGGSGGTTTTTSTGVSGAGSNTPSGDGSTSTPNGGSNTTKAAAPDHSPPHVVLSTSKLRLTTIRSHGASIAFTTTEGGRVAATLTSGSTTIASGHLTFSAHGRHTLTLKLTSAGRRTLRHAHKISLRLHLDVQDSHGNHARSTHAFNVR